MKFPVSAFNSRVFISAAEFELDFGCGNKSTYLKILYGCARYNKETD